MTFVTLDKLGIHDDLVVVHGILVSISDDQDRVECEAPTEIPSDRVRALGKNLSKVVDVCNGSDGQNTERM